MDNQLAAESVQNYGLFVYIDDTMEFADLETMVADGVRGFLVRAVKLIAKTPAGLPDSDAVKSLEQAIFTDFMYPAFYNKIRRLGVPIFAVVEVSGYVDRADYDPDEKHPLGYMTMMQKTFLASATPNFVPDAVVLKVCGLSWWEGGKPVYITGPNFRDCYTYLIDAVYRKYRKSVLLWSTVDMLSTSNKDCNIKEFALAMLDRTFNRADIGCQVPIILSYPHPVYAKDGQTLFNSPASVLSKLVPPTLQELSQKLSFGEHTGWNHATPHQYGLWGINITGMCVNLKNRLGHAQRVETFVSPVSAEKFMAWMDPNFVYGMFDPESGEDDPVEEPTIRDLLKTQTALLQEVLTQMQNLTQRLDMVLEGLASSFDGKK